LELKFSQLINITAHKNPSHLNRGEAKKICNTYITKRQTSSCTPFTALTTALFLHRGATYNKNIVSGGGPLTSKI
jgi:hypothetical protein